jgi:hypothetical protein
MMIKLLTVCAVREYQHRTNQADFRRYSFIPEFSRISACRRQPAQQCASVDDGENFHPRRGELCLC